MAKLNYETVGIDPTLGNFVHNNQNYATAATVSTFLHSEHPIIARKARQLYDVPPIPLLPLQEHDGVMDLDMFPNPPATEASKAYFNSEILVRSALDEMPAM